MLPNETGKRMKVNIQIEFFLAKFKCCFGGDPFPSLVWSHNDSRISEILTAGGVSSIRYQTHKLHDIYYLDIGPVNLSDNGQIKCALMNRFGREDAIAQLFVVGKKKKNSENYESKIRCFRFKLHQLMELHVLHNH
jgi:hypothetical protein